MKRSALLFAFALLLPISAQAARFAAAPAVTKVDGQSAVGFAVDAPTDVEVAVLDAGGKVVRHLAAGVLGGKLAPPSPLKAGLSQQIVWDGKDDFGKPAAGGPFKFRVRAGLGVKFDKLIGADPYVFGGINSMATDAKGNLYLMAGYGDLNQNSDGLRMFTGEGKYVRTLIPFPTTLSPEAVVRFANWDDQEQAFRPLNRSQVNPSILPWNQGARIVSANDRGIVLTHGAEVWRMDLEGGNLEGPLPMWSKEAKLKNPKWNIPQLAVSPDGRYIYYANVAGTQYDTKSPEQIDANWPNGRVYRQDTKAGGDPQPFFDLTLPDFAQQKYWMPNAWNKRTAACAIDIDAKGNLYVCDQVNQQVVQVSPEGKKLNAVAVEWPDRVQVNRATGELYVVVRKPGDGTRPQKLLKVAGWGDAGKVVAEMPLTGMIGDSMSIGLMNGQAVLWLAGGPKIVCVRDAGEKFEAVKTRFEPDPESQMDFNRMSVDEARDEVYTSNGGNRLWRYRGETGDSELLKGKDGKPFLGVDMSVGYDGLLYIRTGGGFAGPLQRFTRELEPAPLASGTHTLSGYIYSRYGVGNCEKGLGIGPNGECYVNYMYGWNAYFLAGFDGQGKPISGKYLRGQIKNDDYVKKGAPEGLDSAVVGPVPHECGGVRVDLQGNIYVGLRGWPKDVPLPEKFAKDPAYKAFTGCVVRFGRDGGTVLGLKDATSEMPDAPRIELEGKRFAENATAIYPGIAPFSGGGYGSNSSVCVCRVPRFGLDSFGRLSMPNCVTNSVTLLDNAGNVICEFGKYGNFDSQFVPEGETKPIVATPDIPLGWPTGAGLTEKAVYVNDTYNKRIVRAVKTYQAEVELAAP